LDRKPAFGVWGNAVVRAMWLLIVGMPMQQQTGNLSVDSQ